MERGVVIRFQAEIKSTFRNSQAVSTNKISKGAACLPPGRPTVVHGGSNDIAVLLNACSQYLVHGPGVWWHREGDYAIFHDPDDICTREEGPKLKHLRSCSI